MKYNNLIVSSFIYYDMQKKKYKKYYNNKNNLKIYHEPNKEPYFELINDAEILMKGEYNLIGIFNNDKKLFRWGWDYVMWDFDNKFMSRNTYYIKKIINYIFSLNINGDNIEEDTFFYKDMKNLFLHHKFIIKNPLQLEQLLAITLYITKSDLIYKIQKNNKTEYYILRNIQIL